MYADSNKQLHIIPDDFAKTPEKLKSFNIGRSAIYICPNQTISLPSCSSASSVSQTPEITNKPTTSRSNIHLNKKYVQIYLL